MQKFRERGPNYAIPAMSNSQAEIDIVEGHRQIRLIHPTDFEKDLTTNRRAGARDRRKRAGQHQLSEISRIISLGKPVLMGNCATRPQDNTTVLYLAIRVEKFGP